MEDKDVVNFAQEYGYKNAVKLGEYEGALYYKPKATVSKHCGYPKFIKVTNNDISLVLDHNLKLTAFFFSNTKDE